MSEPKVDFGGRVSEVDYDRFRSLFPQYGATTWFITTALKSFLKSMEKDPTAHEQVDAAITSMVETNRERVELQRDLAAAVREGREVPRTPR